jgi:hypothetical protein
MRVQAAYDREGGRMQRRGELAGDGGRPRRVPQSWFERHRPAGSSIARPSRLREPTARGFRRHDAIVKVNDTLFVHGGIAPKYAATPRRRSTTGSAGSLRCLPAHQRR